MRRRTFASEFVEKFGYTLWYAEKEAHLPGVAIP